MTNKNLIGLKFGRWTLIEFAGYAKNYVAKWKCRCDCGNEAVVQLSNLKSGNSKSCGCLSKEMAGARVYKHGYASKNTKEYAAWLSMKTRCYNPNYQHFKDYGGRGIKICERWLNSFENFLADIGKAPDELHSLDRYINNDGNYEPGNVRWATSSEQIQNRR